MDWHISFMDSCQDLTIFFAEAVLDRIFLLTIMAGFTGGMGLSAVFVLAMRTIFMLLVLR